MNSRKRCAPEPEHDSKHPRLASGPQNLAASAPEEGRLLKRWAMVSKQLIELVVDTATTLVPVWQPVPPPLSNDAMSSSSATSSSPVSTPRQTPTPHNSNDIAVIHESTTPTQGVSAPIHSPTSPNFLEHFNNEHVLDGVVFSTPKPQKHQISGSQPGTASSSQCTPDRTLNRDVVPHLTSLHLEGASSSRQSSQASQSSSSLINSTLGSEISRQDKPSKYHPLRRNPRQREHILAKSHKQYVAREKTKMRDEVIHLKRELYRVKRKSGYSSGFDDLQGLLDYQRTLESLDLERDSRRPGLSVVIERIFA
ncbi:hypothetical protein CPC08DRAFT_31213 [Agrocybe pediades]|nr:hypothetical protein CPC08DRAFT_31213 [Agrocybe pediades]